MKRIISLLLFAITFSIFAQKQANIWYFGRNAGIDFNSGTPVALTNGQLNTLEGCSSFSDENGNLLFYSDGITVWDKNHQVMRYSNGNLANNLLGNPSSTQSGMIVPKPNSTTIFYLFTIDDGPTFNNAGNMTESGKGLNFYTIDMSKNSGNGEIVAGPVDLSNGRGNQWSEKVAAVRGRDCNTFWIVSVVSNTFYAYKIDSSGVITTPVTSTISVNATNRGYLKLSPDGSKLAFANQRTTNQAYLLSFNNQTGVVSDDGVLLLDSTDGSAYGVEFSADSQKLYISTNSGMRFSLSDPETTYKLFYFDLTQANIPGSKAIIHQQTPGFRGALQLGPDTKIYATIPLAYDDSNGDATSLDVIENPSATQASDVIFRKNAVSLGGQKSTQGLPPFIASLLLPIEIKTSTSNKVVNNQAVQKCIGESIQFNSESVTGNNITYEWTFDDNTSVTTIATTPNLQLNNLQTTNAGKYKLTVSLEDGCGNTQKLEGNFSLEIHPNFTINTPNDINFCDTNNDGFNNFNLNNDVTSQVLNGQNADDFEVLYYLNQANANANTNAITSPYTNPSAFSSQTIYVRMHNKNAPNACYKTTTFQLNVNRKPAPSQPSDYLVCDDTASGNDTDGYYNSFLLSNKDSEILGALSPTAYNISYHTSLSGANTSSTTDVINKNVNYRNTIKDEQIIYVRIENANNTSCFTVSNPVASSAFKPFKLIVNPLPRLKSNQVSIRQCDDNLDLVTTVNLSQAEINLSSNFENETFKYYESEFNAINDTSEITNTTAYPVNGNAQVWARVISNQGCYRIGRIDVIISAAGNVTYNEVFETCDDLLDRDGNDTANNSDTDGISYFNFNKAIKDIPLLFPSNIRNDLEIQFYETQNDRNASLNKIANPNNYRNTNLPAQTQQIIYIKIVNKINNDCAGFAELFIRTISAPTATQMPNIVQCDDTASGSNVDGIINIDLTSYIPAILAGQPASDYQVTFHKTSTEAHTGEGKIVNISNFSNTPQTGFEQGDVSEQTIYVRVENRASKCFNAKTSFKIIVNPIPFRGTITPLEICDAGTEDNNTINGLEQQIDLSVVDRQILKDFDRNKYNVTYHRDETNATNKTNAVNKNDYDNDPANTVVINGQGQERIWVNVRNSETGCQFVGSFLIKISSKPNVIQSNITRLLACDDDADGDTSNGKASNINLTVKEDEILRFIPTAERTNYKISYHRTLQGAQTNAEVIADDEKTSFSNVVNPQKVYIRVENKNTGCANSDTYLDVFVTPLPEFEITTPQIICLNNLPLTLRVENPRETYNYKWTRSGETTELSNSRTLTINEGGTYEVTATNINTGCKKTIPVTVKESKIAKITDNDITIIDDSDNNSIKVNIAKLGIGDYEFALNDLYENPISDFKDEPYFDNLKGGFYTVLVRDKNGCGIAKIEVSVLEFPKFFTPNNDSKNDFWKITGANEKFYPGSKVYIFDRFGKLLTQLPITRGWNGTYNGQTLPSNDYWFKAELVDKKGKIRIRKGHFSLLRR